MHDSPDAIADEDRSLSPQDVARALEGDRQAMQALVQRVLPVVQTEVGYALLRGARAPSRDPRQEVRDFVQEVFVSLLAKDGKTLRAWDPNKPDTREGGAAMSDASHELDAIAEALGHRADERELAKREPEWDAVARGELDVDEAVARRRALGDEDELLERGAAYFRPFDADETGSLIDGLLDKRKPASTKAESEPQKPKHDPGSSGFWWIPGGLLAAAAAAIVLWWVWPRNEDITGFGDDGPKIASVEPLPAYVLETDGGLEKLRGGGDELGRHRYQRETKFEWILRPKVDEPGEVGVRGFAFVDGGSAGLPLAALDELAQIAEFGAIRIAGTIEQLDLEPGIYTIELAVGRPADLPTQAAEVHDPAADAAWQLRRVEIEIED